MTCFGVDVSQVTEETGDETQVQVDLGQAAKEAPKPTRVSSVEETHEVITTREDVAELTEEQAPGHEVEVSEHTGQKQGVLASRVRGAKTYICMCFSGTLAIAEVDLHSDHVLEHSLFSRLRKAKTLS